MTDDQSVNVVKRIDSKCEYCSGMFHRVNQCLERRDCAKVMKNHDGMRPIVEPILGSGNQFVQQNGGGSDNQRVERSLSD
jgi:hypothetical protein